MTPEHRAKLEHIASEAIMADTREAITAALARIDALEADAARLDWLERSLREDEWPAIGVEIYRGSAMSVTACQWAQDNMIARETIREAIDAAREGR